MSGALEIPMSVEEYHCHSRRLGWEYDYEGYRAIVAPADILVDVSRSVATPVEAGSIGPLRLCLAEAEKAFALEDLYFQAFRPSAETVGHPDADVQGDATMAMILYAGGAVAGHACPLNPYRRA